MFFRVAFIITLSILSRSVALAHNDNWCQYRNSYYPTYVSGRYFSYSFSRAKEACVGVRRSECAGITQEPYNRNRYTLRRGPDRGASPHGETSWGECESDDNTDCWQINRRTSGSGPGRLLKYYGFISKQDCAETCKRTPGCTSVAITPQWYHEKVCYITSQDLIGNSDSIGWSAAYSSCFEDETPPPPTIPPTEPPTEDSDEEEEDGEDGEEEDRDCRDKLETCPLLSRQGRCSAPDVLANCQLSCRQCVCGDSYRQCAAWSNLGMCTSPAMRDFMRLSCRMSCGVCQCQDLEIPCYRWAHAGHCTKDPVYMLATCPASCNQCQCGDNSPDCIARAMNGECYANAKFMLTHCAKACNQCGDGCADNPPYTAQCAQWVGFGWCSDEEKQGFMMINCPKSCKFCEGEEDDEGDGTDTDEDEDEDVPWNSVTYWMAKGQDKE